MACTFAEILTTRKHCTVPWAETNWLTYKGDDFCGINKIIRLHSFPLREPVPLT